MTELMPCPFCGGEAAHATIKYCASMVREQEWEQDTFHYCNCVRCGSSNLGVVGHRTVSDAAANWNNRPAEAKLQKAREALEFYANPKIYEPHPHGIGFDRRDVSFKAIATLKEIGEDNG